LRDLGISKTQSSRWQKLASLDEGGFETRIAEAKRRAIASIETTRVERAVEKRERRQAREADLAAKQLALPDRRFGVVLADPGWRWEPYCRETGMDRAADNHYPTSSLEEIKATDVASIAADDCVLLLWSTVPMMPQALEVMTAWGFEYKTNFVWVKDRAGTGYWNRNQHELLLVGTRGNIPAPAPGEQRESVIHAPVGAHSEKPALFYELIESYFPNLPKMELFARGRRDGWDAWGLEAPASAA
jgi:N6-adenosine-specific RNA methylase IME4